jgi:hypothetical protein
MDALTLFGLASLTAMLIFYALRIAAPGISWPLRAHARCGSGYGFMQGAWPFGVVEAIWSVIAIRRWRIKVMRGPTRRSASRLTAPAGPSGRAEPVIPRYRAASVLILRFLRFRLVALRPRPKARSGHRKRSAGCDDGLCAVLAAAQSFQSLRRLFLSLAPGRRSPVDSAISVYTRSRYGPKERLRRQPG